MKFNLTFFYKRLAFILIINFFAGVLIPVKAQEVFHLAPPILVYNSIIFKDAAVLTMKFAMPGASVHYTLDGSEPSLVSAEYKAPIIVKKNGTVVKAASFCTGFKPSNTVEVNFVKAGKLITSIEGSTPNPKYPGRSPGVLYDLLAGGMAFGNGDWMGFNEDTVLLNVHLSKKERVDSISVHALRSQESWIFLPQKINYYQIGKHGNRKLLGSLIFPLPEEKEKSDILMLTMSLEQLNIKDLQIEIITLDKIPGWHDGKGKHAWFFVDEVMVQ